MKKLLVLLILCCLLPLTATAENFLPARTDIVLEKGLSLPVYYGPNKEAYQRMNNGKAKVSTNGPVEILGAEDDALLIQYEISENRYRIGYILILDLPEYLNPYPWQQWEWSYAKAVQTTSITDDPFHSREKVATLKKGDQVQVLKTFGDWAYIDCPPLRGFVPANALEMQPVPYERSEGFVWAENFLKDAGIDARVTGMHNNYLFFSLPGGGTASYFTYSSFSPYDMNWHFDGITDGEMALFLDHYLGMLVQVELGLAPEAHLQLDYHDGQGLRNIDVTVSNGLGYMENEGDAWLNVLLHQLSLHDGNDALNSMRARLASRMLGKRDITPIDPKEGCAWYDALTLSQQNALPPVDAATYVEDPLLSQLTQQMIAYTDERKATWHSDRDVENENTRNIVALSVHKMEETADQLTLWAMVFESEYALYDSSRYQSISGSITPRRIEYQKNASGNWALKTVIECGEGTEYYPSVLAFCDGDIQLANAIISDFSVNLDACFFQYLQHHGYPVPEKIPY